ncbi:hypothetical protein JOB18_002122 [Solea senegalensis]|nr:hypothetical protein JOB18_002122 [Solea senegalensis]KAG7504156.1 hypothetical protein JOB18_002122 [Solea senegalensis]
MCGREGSRGLQGSDGGLRCLCEERSRGDVVRKLLYNFRCPSIWSTALSPPSSQHSLLHNSTGLNENNNDADADDDSDAHGVWDLAAVNQFPPLSLNLPRVPQSYPSVPPHPSPPWVTFPESRWAVM